MSIKEMLEIYRERGQKPLHAFLLIVLVVIWFLRATGAMTAISQDINYGLVLGVIAFLLWDIAQNTYQLQRTKVFAEQDDLYHHLQKITMSNPPSEAIVVQYSGKKSDPLVTSLLKQGANVTLYIKNPSKADSEFQKKRIEDSLESLSNEVKTREKAGKLTIKTYSNPASLRAVLVDRDILAVGWYTFYIEAESSDSDQSNGVVIHGHNAPGILCYRGSKEFAVLIQEFDKLTANFDQAHAASSQIAEG